MFSQYQSMDNQSMSDLNTALIDAVTNNRLVKVQKLLKEPGININYLTDHSESPIVLAVNNKNEAIIIQLYRAGANLLAINRKVEPDSFLGWAIKNKFINLAELIISRSSLKDLIKANNANLYKLAMSADAPNIIENLLDAGLTVPPEVKRECIKYATDNNQTSLLKKLCPERELSPVTRVANFLFGPKGMALKKIPVGRPYESGTPYTTSIK